MEKETKRKTSVLTPVTPEEFEKLEIPTEEEMRRALDAGKADRDAMEASGHQMLVSRVRFR